MTERDLVDAQVWALTGQRATAAGGDVHAVLAELGWDRSAILAHARAVTAQGEVWPHPVPDDLRHRIGAARLLAAVQRVQLSLGLLGEQAAPATPRPLNADEHRLLQDVPPHHGT